MKKINIKTLGAIALIALITLTLTIGARAGVFLLAGSGVTIPPNCTTNFAQLVQVGTFTLNNQALYLTQNGASNAGAMIANGRLTFDGTNFFVLPQFYTNRQAGPTNNELWTVTNITLPVYGALSVSNAGTPITNFSAAIQQ
jgi:hypothetical protein